MDRKTKLNFESKQFSFLVEDSFLIIIKGRKINLNFGLEHEIKDTIRP